MDYTENVHSNQNNNINFVSQPPHLTRDQEHEIMVLALRQVISSSSGGCETNSSWNWNSCEALPPLDAGPCPLCNITGCYGCAFPRQEEIKKENKKHKGVRKRPSGKWSAEIWDPSKKVRRWIGTFPTAEMAAHAYDEVAAEIVGRRPESGEGSIHQKDGGGR